MHWLARLQNWPPVHVPHWPPQPSSPQVLSAQSGSQAGRQRPLQTRPPSQVLPGQQVSPKPPHSRQIAPPEKSQPRPASQVSPGQQGFPGAPQSQVKPAPVQAVPGLQIWSQQKPLVGLQTPLAQSLFSSHAVPSAALPTQRPSSQCAASTQSKSSRQLTRQRSPSTRQA